MTNVNSGTRAVQYLELIIVYLLLTSNVCVDIKSNASKYSEIFASNELSTI